jgi:hypothetical protein
MKIIIVEYKNEYDQYVFYGAYTNGTPKLAVEHYLVESGLFEDENPNYNITIESENSAYCDVCRAYAVKTEKL